MKRLKSNSRILVALLALIPVGAAQAQETHRVLVVPVSLRGRAPPAVDRSQIAQALFGAQDSVASRYRSISYGKVEFEGSERDIVDPVPLSEPGDLCNKGLGIIAREAEDALRRQGTSLATYQHFVFVLPKNLPCPWVGVGDIGGNRAWIKATTAKALQHELGHNLGMAHAVRWQSADADRSDFMGSGSTSLNAPHVVEMGWLNDYPGKVVELTGADGVTLEALETDPRRSALPKVAIVRAGADTYYLSYRASSSADPVPDDFTRGLNIHIFDEGKRPPAQTYFVTALSDGADYRVGSMNLRQLSHVKGESVTFNIAFAGPGQAEPPSSPPGTVQSLASGKCLDLPGGHSEDGIQPIQFDCHGGLNQQWSVESAGNTGYRIVSRLSGKCIGTDPGGAVAQRPCDGSPSQLWTLRGSGNAYVLQNATSGLCLDVPGGSSANGAKPIAWSCNGGTNQTWRFTRSGTP